MEQWVHCRCNEPPPPRMEGEGRASQNQAPHPSGQWLHCLPPPRSNPLACPFPHTGLLGHMWLPASKGPWKTRSGSPEPQCGRVPPTHPVLVEIRTLLPGRSEGSTHLLPLPPSVLGPEFQAVIQQVSQLYRSLEEMYDVVDMHSLVWGGGRRHGDGCVPSCFFCPNKTWSIC